MNRKPLGLVVLGVMAGLGGVLMALLLLAVDEKADISIVLVREAAAALAAASLIAAEALVRVRPWFYRASLGLSVTWCVVVTCGAIAFLGLAGIPTAMVVIAFSLIVLLPVMVYIRDEWDRMRRAAMRVPAPPRPWPVPGRIP
jgi:hypothetical protein